MASPAEIIAARVNGTSVPADAIPDDGGSDSTATSTNGSATGAYGAAIRTATPTLDDASAFPVLGGARESSPPAGAWAATPAPKFRASSIQEAFSLDADDQLNVSRAQFIKALTEIKSATHARIECTTLQHTKKRTFLISGTPEQVKDAKRLVIKRLTKPMTLTFHIPAAIRAKVIGAQGRNLRPIVEQNEVKIDIDREEDAKGPADEDDIFARTVLVAVSGDGEGCRRARTLIMAIVKAETKNTVLRVSVEDIVKPFLKRALESVIAAHPTLDITVPEYPSAGHSVIVAGERAEALEARDQIREAVAQLELRLVVEPVPIPATKHQFLPVEAVLAEHNVWIQLPGPGETAVKFVGELANIPAAQESARKTTSQYRVEVLDMAKAHKGNLAHVRAVAAWLAKNGTFARIAEEHGVAVNPPSIAFLEDDSQTSIPVEIVVKTDDTDATKAARRAIVAAVNSITPDQTKVVDDLDLFVLPRAPALLDAADANYVVLNGAVVLFDSAEAADGDDFDEAPTDTLDVAAAALDPLRTLDVASKIVSVPEEQQTHILGPKDSTLKAILAAVDSDATVSFVGDEVHVHGLRPAVTSVVKDIETVLADAAQYKDGYTATVEVPVSVLPRIIGKGGAGVNALRDQYSVKIDVGDANDEKKTEISVSGVRRNADAAKDAIAALAKKLADDTLVRLRIERQYHRRIVGPAFSSINRLQDKYNVRIHFPPENSNEDVTIRGPSKNVARAEEELKALYEFERENGYKSTIQVPVKAIARVIGRNGETIRDITDGSGVEYHSNRDRKNEDELGYVEIELTGSKTALKEAQQKIDAIIKEAENFVSVTVHVPPKYHRDLVGPSGSVMRHIIEKAGGADLSRLQYSRLLTIPNAGSDSDEVVCQGDQAIVAKVVKQIEDIVAEKEASVHVKYDLPKEKHRLIIGPAGSTRHQLEEEFKVRMDIPRAKDASTEVDLFGLPENIDKLKIKLDELTKDNWNECVEVPAQYHAFVSDNGVFITTLRSRYNVEVNHGDLSRQAGRISKSPVPVPPENEDPEQPFTFGSIPESTETGVIPWRLIGDAEATAKAAALVEEQLERAKNADCAAWFHSSNPSVQFPRIIGPLGRKINQIRKNSGVFITVPRSGEKNNEYIYLVGSRDSVEKAKEEIIKAI